MKKIQIHSWLTIMAMLVFASTASAQLDSSSFNHKYDGDVYPVPNYTEFPAETNWVIAPSTDGDILTYQTEILQGSGYWFGPDWNLPNATGWTLEFRVRILNNAADDPTFGAMQVFAKDGGNVTASRRAILAIGKNFITLSSRGNLVLDTAENTNDFHIIRMSQPPNANTVKVWRDGVLLFNNSSATGNSSTAGQLYFGDGSGGVGGPTVKLDYFRWDNTGAHDPIVVAPAVVQSPQNTTNLVATSVTLTAIFTNAITSVQWYKDNNPISPNNFSTTSAGQASTYTIASLQPTDEGTYYCAAVNSAGSTNTAEAYLDVLPDVTPPTVVSNVVSAWAKRVRVKFSEATDPVSTGESTNYVFQGGALSVASVTVLDSTRVDVFTTSHPLPGSNYVLEISNVQDTSANPIVANTPVAFTVGTNFPAMTNLIMAFNENSAVASVYGGMDWKDLSGSENHAGNPNAVPNRRPTLVANSLQGHGVFHFAPTSTDIIAQRVTFTGSVGLDQSNYTWFAVARCSNLGTGTSGTATPRSAVVLRFVTNAVLDPLWVSEMGRAFHNGEPNLPSYAGEPGSEYQKAVYSWGRDGAGNQLAAFSYPIANDQWYVIGGHADPGGSISAVLDPIDNRYMVQTNATSPVGTGVYPPDSVWFGSYGDNRYRFGGDMAEVLLYTGDLGESGFDSVMNYLRVKYFPPYISVNPNGANVEVNFTGVLQSSTNGVNGTYYDVSGSPTSPYAITPGSQLPEQYFRARNP